MEMFYNILFAVGIINIVFLICCALWMANEYFGIVTLFDSIRSKWYFNRSTTVFIHGKQKHFNTMHDAFEYLHQKGIYENRIIKNSIKSVWLEAHDDGR